MNVTQICNRQISIDLNPEEALLVAQALEHAKRDDLFSGPEVHHFYLDSLASVFAVAAYAGGLASRADELPSYKDLRDDRMIDRGFAVVLPDGNPVSRIDSPGSVG